MAANPRALAKALVAANPTPSNLPVGGFGGAPATLPAGQLSPMVASYEAWTNGRSNGPGLPRDWSAFLAGSFGPLAPIQPISIDNPEPGMERPDPRRYQYQVGWNMPIGPPGSEGLKLATFPQLRTIADTYSVARACINLRKQELVGLEWDIIPTKAAEKKMRGHISDRQEWDTRRARMMRFFRKPDSNYFSFASWFSAQLEDVFAVDALSLYMHPSRMRGKGVMGSDLAAFELIDGTTIRPMIDVHGAKPTPPNPAYQQFIYGVPRVDLMTVMSGDDIKDMGEAKYRQYTGDQLMYLPYDARDWTPYGFAPVEKALVPILSGLNRQNWQLEYFSEGSIPGLFITNGDANATPQQNREFQDALNAMAGDPAWKHKIIVLPGGSQTMPQTPADLAGQFDEMIMGQVCMAFDVMPMELGITPGRSTSGHSGGAVNQMGKLSTEAQHRKANTPLLHRMMEIYDYIIQVVAHQDDMRFMFEGLGEIEDEATQINNLVNEVSHGLKSIDEARIIRGEQPWGLPITSDPVLVIATGLIPLKGLDPVTGQPPQPIMPAAPIGPGGAPAGPGGPPPAGGPSAGQPAAPKPTPQPTAPAAAATPAHAGATTAGPTSSNKQATDTGNDGEAPAHVNTFAALRELDLIGRRLTKGVSIAGWRREHIPADVFTTLTGPGAVADARQLLKGIDRAQRKTDAVTESTRAVSEGLRMLAGGLSNGRIAPATFVDRAVTTIRNGIRTAIGNGAGHARADGISKVAIPAGFESRFQLYAGAIFKAYEQGYGLATYGGADDPDNIVVRWHAKPGACVLCGPRDGGLYTIGGLPGFPGDGGFGKSATICVGGPNCRCALSYEKLAPGEARPADDGGTPTPVQQQIAAAVSAASKALHGPDPETAFSRVLDNHADQLAELQRPYVTGLYQDVLAARNDQQAQDTVEATYTRAPDGGPGWLVPTAVVSALIAAELYAQAQSQQQAAPATTTGTAPAATKSAGPAVPAATITAQLSRNYPADALGWVGGARWIGPVHLPTDAVDTDSVNQWTASHQPGRVGHFAAELRTDPETVRPVIAVHEPGETNVKIVDGHHRYLAARQDGQPVTAYIGQVDSNSGPWDELHTHQIHQGDDPENKAAYADLMKVGPKGYIHGWIFVGARPRVGKAVRQTKRDRKGNIVTDRTGRVSAVKDGHVHITWDDGKANRVEHVHETGVKGGLARRSTHTSGERKTQPVKAPAPVKAEPKPARTAPAKKAAPAKETTPGSTDKTAWEILDSEKDPTEHMSKLINGTYGGLTVRVHSASRKHTTGGYGETLPASIEAHAKIFDKRGNQVGSLERTVSVDRDGNLYATHKLLKLDENQRGQGFAEELNGHLENWYRKSGVKRIELLANIDVGGYAWARSGYDFPDGVPGMVKRRIQEELNRGKLTVAEENTLKAMLENGSRATAYELSQIGRPPGAAGKAATWPGKRILLGSTWEGVRWL